MQILLYSRYFPVTQLKLSVPRVRFIVEITTTREYIPPRDAQVVFKTPCSSNWWRCCIRLAVLPMCSSLIGTGLSPVAWRPKNVLDHHPGIRGKETRYAPFSQYLEKYAGLVKCPLFVGLGIYVYLSSFATLLELGIHQVSLIAPDAF